MPPLPREVLQGTRRLLCFLGLLLYLVILAVVTYYFLIFLTVPTIAFSEYLLPAVHLFFHALTPATDIFFHEVVWALGVFVVSLALPGALYSTIRLVLLPLYFELSRQVF